MKYLPVPDELATLSLYNALCSVLGVEAPCPGVDEVRYDQARRVVQILNGNCLHMVYAAATLQEPHEMAAC